MIRTISLALVALALFALPAYAAEPARISGHVVEVRDGGQTLVLAEQGPWYGPNTGVVQRTIALSPGTSVRLVRSTGEWANEATPGYQAQRMDLQDLKHGDFVTVTLRSGGAQLVEVMLPNEGGLASPRLELIQKQ